MHYINVQHCVLRHNEFYSMARNIKPYNYSYRIAKRFLKENPKAEFTYTVIYTIAHLPKKYNYSKEGVKRAWDDHQKSSVVYWLKWPKWRPDYMVINDAVDSINWAHLYNNTKWTIK